MQKLRQVNKDVGLVPVDWLIFYAIIFVTIENIVVCSVLEYTGPYVFLLF